MAVFKDIKNIDSKKLLKLNKDEFEDEAKQSLHVLDLSNLNGSDTKTKRSKLKKHRKRIKHLNPKGVLDIQNPQKNKDDYLFFTEEVNKNLHRRSYSELFRFVAAAFAVLFLFNVIHIGKQLFDIFVDVEVNAFDGYHDLVDGGKSAIDSNFGGAVQSFESASFAFAQAQKKVWFLGNSGMSYGNGGIGESAYFMLEAGELISNSASYFSQGMSSLSEIPVLFMQNNSHSDKELTATKISLTEKLKLSLDLFDKALSDIEVAQDKIKLAGNQFLPAKFKEHFNTLNTQVNDLIYLLRTAQKRVPAIMTMLGDRYPHRYLVLLQNNAEARPTGGFIGSYIIVDVNDGYITKMDFHDIYDSDGQLNDFIQAPDDIANLTDNWRMRDSNYTPDFPLSAAKAAWFLEQEEGPSVDTIIVINQSILEDLLTITGPIDLDSLDAPLTSENYNTILTYIVESKLEGINSPKGIINRLILAMQSKLYNQTSFKSLFTLIQQSIKEKNILAWSKDDDVQAFFEDVGMSGEVAGTGEDEDYFSMITINIGGNKSDIYMKSEITHETVLDENGDVKDIVTLKRKHTWNPDIILKWEDDLAAFGYSDISEGIQNILGRANNKSVIKFYMPAGSKLVNITGVAIEDVTQGYDAEIDKNYIYFISDIAYQEEQEILFTYVLKNKMDFSIADEYRLTVQKQPGNLDDVKFKKRIIPNAKLVNLRNYPEEIVNNQNEVLEYETTLKTDQHFASLWAFE